MNRLERAAVVTDLVGKMEAGGSWCGETHIQKAVYFLQRLLKMSLGYEFILYRYGPFSFDLRQDLAEMRADDLLGLAYRSSYGPSHYPTEYGNAIRARFTKAENEAAIAFVVANLSSKGVLDLEALATALYCWAELGMTEVDMLVTKLRELKPRLNEVEARSAVIEFLSLAEEASAIAGA